MDDDDSFGQYINNLQKLPDYIEVQCPVKPLNSYMMYNFQKACEQKKKRINGHINDDENFNASHQIANSWNNLSKSKKEELDKNYEKKLTKYNRLYEEYILLSMQKKILNPYSRFYRKLFGIYQTQYHFQTVEITKLIKKAWKKLPKQDKQVYQAEYEEQKQILREQLENRQQKIQLYHQKLQVYKKEQVKEREQILKKYQLNPDSLDKFKEMVHFFKNQKNQKRRDKRRKTKQFQREEEQKRLKENGNRLRQLKQLEIQELKKERILIQKIEESQKESQMIKNSLKESELALAAVLGSQKTFDSQKIQSDQESPKSHKTKKITKVEKYTPKKTAKKEKGLV